MWSINNEFKDELSFYQDLHQQLSSLISGEKNLVANLSNLSSYLYHSIPGLNWCGFYLWDHEDQELVLGPFQGKPACLRIKANRGVCGASYSRNQSLRVDDVHEFPGHIACDSASRSELVIPLRFEKNKWGVLDLDSPSLNHFSLLMEQELQKIFDDLSPKIF